MVQDRDEGQAGAEGVEGYGECVSGIGSGERKQCVVVDQPGFQGKVRLPPELLVERRTVARENLSRVSTGERVARLGVVSVDDQDPGPWGVCASTT